VTDSGLPPPPEPIGLDGGCYLGEKGWLQVLECMRKGTWRQSTVAKAFGISPSAINERKRRRPEWGLEFDKAKADGEQALVDKLVKCGDEGRSGHVFQWLLERIHGYTSPVDKAKIENLRAQHNPPKPEPVEPDERFL
jgi:hypothetical protein